MTFDVLVIGAGQAGLALGHHLARRGADFLLLDAGPEVGHSWRSRWDSLRLFSPAQYDSLPGMTFPAPDGIYHPTKDDVADYLQAYAQRFRLPVRLNSPVFRLHRAADGTFTAATPTGTVHARQVVVATGPFQRPAVPRVAAGLGPQVVQLHSADYRNPAEVPPGPVLIVGGGNSGLQIAEELAASHQVTLAVGSRPMRLPQRLLGRDLFWWLSATGMITRTADSPLARRMQARGDLLIGSSYRRAAQAGVDVRPRVTGATGSRAVFEDGSSVAPDTVVWATGFRSDYSWIDVPGVLEGGVVRHRRGETDVPGLSFIGLPWQHTRGSALLGFVKHDAEWLTARIAARRPVRAAEPSPDLSLGWGRG